MGTLRPIIFFLLFSAGSIAMGFTEEPMKITSPDITPGDYIPQQFTCQGMNKIPRLEFINIPEAARTLALIVHDPDAPSGDWVHWVIFNIPARHYILGEGFALGVTGRNSSGTDTWEGPCPPSGIHHYIFSAYALDIELPLKRGASRKDVEKSLEGHILDKAELVGLYEKF